MTTEPCSPCKEYVDREVQHLAEVLRKEIEIEAEKDRNRDNNTFVTKADWERGHEVVKSEIDQLRIWRTAVTARTAVIIAFVAVVSSSLGAWIAATIVK